MNKSERIETILLDLDDTLYAYDAPHEFGLQCMLDSFCNLFSVERQKIKEIYNISRKRINERLLGQAASHSRLLYAKEMCESIGINPILFAEKLEATYWNNFLTKMVLNEGVQEFLDYCKTEKIRICIVTDLTTEIQLKKIRRLNLEGYIDQVVTSEEAGVEKPNPRIFSLAIQKIKADPHSTLMVGDNFEKDIIGAREFGIRAIHFTKSDIGEDTISSFLSLKDKIS